jgi:hypothetical protein
MAQFAELMAATARVIVPVHPGFDGTPRPPQTVVLLNTFTPDLYVQYFRDLRATLATGQPLTPQTIEDVMARYGTEPAPEHSSAPGPAQRAISADAKTTRMKERSR